MGCCASATDEPSRRRTDTWDLDAALPPTPTNSNRQEANKGAEGPELYRRRQMTADDRIREARRHCSTSSTRGMCEEGTESMTAAPPAAPQLKDDSDAVVRAEASADALRRESGASNSNPLIFNRVTAASSSRGRLIHSDYFAAVRNTVPVPLDDPHWRLRSSTAGLGSSTKRAAFTAGHSASPKDPWISVNDNSGTAATAFAGEKSSRSNVSDERLRAVSTHFDAIGAAVVVAGAPAAVCDIAAPPLWAVFVGAHDEERMSATE